VSPEEHAQLTRLFAEERYDDAASMLGDDIMNVLKKRYAALGDSAWFTGLPIVVAREIDIDPLFRGDGDAHFQADRSLLSRVIRDDRATDCVGASVLRSVHTGGAPDFRSTVQRSVGSGIACSCELHVGMSDEASERLRQAFAGIGVSAMAVANAFRQLGIVFDRLWLCRCGVVNRHPTDCVACGRMRR
jgi:hypothetical protein